MWGSMGVDNLHRSALLIQHVSEENPFSPRLIDGPVPDQVILDLRQTTNCGQRAQNDPRLFSLTRSATLRMSSCGFTVRPK
jgi:hypothetical protein